MGVGLLKRVRQTILSLPGLRAMAAPLLFLVIIVLSYGLWLPRLGLFGDDWSYVWYYHLLGPMGPGEFAAIDRPVSAWFYAASMVLLGEAAWPYHLFLLLLRWASTLLFWWVLRLAWPSHSREAALAALLMAVYPGFRQNPIAVEFILHFAVLDLFLLSLAASFLAVRRPNQFWRLAVLSALGASGLFSLEYFAGLEILRPLLLWAAATQAGLRGRQRIWAVMKSWLPVLLVCASFLIWRVFVFQFPTYEPVVLSEMASSPLQGLVSLAKQVINGLIVALPNAWRQTLSLPTEASLRLPFLVVTAASFALAALLLWKVAPAVEAPAAKAPAQRSPFGWGEAAFVIGLVAMVAGGAPFWLTGIPITLEFPWDRPTLALMPGASLALAGLVSMLITPRYRPLASACLVSLAVGMHFLNGNVYLKEWQKLQSFTWQLAWRAPALEPGTLLLFDVIPLNRYSDNDLTALLNWTYAPHLQGRAIPYRYFDLTIRLNEEHAGLPGLEKGLPVEHDQRGTAFSGSTSQVLVLDYQPPACLKVLAPEDANWPGLSDRLKLVLPLSDLGQIQGGAESGEGARPPAVLGTELEHGWCYTFQKAELAVQQGNWAEVTRLAEQAQDAGWKPAEVAEYLPLIEGYAQTGAWQQAQALAAEVAQSQAAHASLCRLWGRIQAKAVQDQAAPGVFQAIGCSE